jgi:hypothetical protein
LSGESSGVIDVFVRARVGRFPAGNLSMGCQSINYDSNRNYDSTDNQLLTARRF